MPFTFSHPAVILPILRRRPWSAPALVVGTVVPDFSLYCALPDRVYQLAHTPMGILTVCFPAGLVFFSFLCLVRPEITETLPPQFRALFERLRLLDLSWRSWGFFSVILSLLVGSTLHVFIERSFDSVPVLRHSLSLFGLLITGAYIVYHLTRNKGLRETFGDPADVWSHSLWFTLIATPTAIALISEFIALRAGGPIPVDVFVFDVLTKAIASFFAIYAIIVLFLKSRKPA